jgi:type II secretory pathway pseudopilin PulG
MSSERALRARSRTAPHLRIDRWTGTGEDHLPVPAGGPDSGKDRRQGVLGMRRKTYEPGDDGVTLKMSHKQLKTTYLTVGLPHAARRTPHATRGFTYIALLAAIVIIGISLGAAGKYWQNVMMREKEEELLFRGEQYRLAIERYFLAFPGRFQYPQNLDELLKDSRSAAGKRHLRQKYMDPITGEDFEVIRDLTKGNRITGVYSKSDKEPIRTTGFDDPYKEFEGKKKYNEWKFVFTTPSGTQGLPLGMVLPRPAIKPPPPAPNPSLPTSR